MHNTYNTTEYDVLNGNNNNDEYGKWGNCCLFPLLHVVTTSGFDAGVTSVH
jgi:hypothetical protein